MDHCPEWDLQWLSLLCRARKHIADSTGGVAFDWSAAEVAVWSVLRRVLAVPVGSGSQPSARAAPVCYARLFLRGVNVPVSRLAKISKLAVFFAGRRPQALDEVA